MKDLIRGSGGGDTPDPPKEYPNTLQSVQFARVIDLVSEGEIGGLVNGSKSVYINETPLMNSDGALNFSGVTYEGRVGTQNQTYIPGIPAVENEVVVATEVTKEIPVVRSISNSNVNAARITVSVPALTKQSMSTGDIKGTKVNLQIHIQNNGGGFVPAKIQTSTLDLTLDTTTANSGSSAIISSNIGINWIGNPSSKVPEFQTCEFIIEKRALGAEDWEVAISGNFTGTTFQAVSDDPVINYYYKITGVFDPPASSQTFDLTLNENPYEFRVVKTSGIGTLTIAHATGNYWTPDVIIDGKTTSKYQRSYTVNLPQPGPWDIRVSRVTDDSTKQTLQNKTVFDSYTEIVEAKLSYPNSALFGLQIDARQFNAIPSRAYEIYGIKVKVPDNYNPITRAYTGEWSGNFNTAWTDNPAWIFYDIVTNDRYGLGNYVDINSVDKWGLYNIAKYCDELVPTGLGGLEPRFTCNVYLQSRYNAFDLITQLASVFRAMTYWSSEQITCVQDAPADPIALFTAANVIDGQFNYSGSSAKARHTVCLVTWNDPSDLYRQKVEYVEDPEGIARYGVVQAEVGAFGCTSRGQAHRLGKWLLYSERLETETVSFRAGYDAALIYPGAIIQTQDQFRSGKRLGGRVVTSVHYDITIGTMPDVVSTWPLISLIGTQAVTLDSAVEIESGKTYELSVVMPDGTIESANVVNAPGTSATLVVSPPFTDNPIQGAIWVLAVSDLALEEWRVISIAEAEEGIVEISALSSRRDKYDLIEQDIQLQPVNTTSITASAPVPVEDVTVVESLYLITQSIVGNQVIVSWYGTSPRYVISYSTEGDNPRPIDVDEPSYTFNDLQPGTYTFSIQAVNALGRRSQVVSVTEEVYGLSIPPSDVSGFTLAAIAGAAHIAFNASADLDVRVGGSLRLRHSASSTSWNDAIDIGVSISGTSTSAVVPLLQGNYFAKWVDSTGNESTNAVMVTTNAPNLMQLNFVESLVEHPSFTGVKDSVGVDTFGGEPCLTLVASLTIDEMPSIDDWPLFSEWSDVATEGEYFFSSAVDLGAVYTSRITADLQSYGFLPDENIDAWGLIDDIASLDGDIVTDVSAKIYIRKSDDNVTFSAWEPLLVGDYLARAFEFKLRLTSANGSSIAVTRCSVNVDMPDTVQAQEDITSGAGTYTVTYPTAYYANPAIGVTAQNMQTGDYYVISNKTNTGFDILFKNTAGTPISRTFDYIAKGY